ncbi:LLM class flavin-dependent oxidoreductase [Zavarzinia sp.]|uniref:LLM class flavin-dependent oxidoreductase n=1 Tax=Zavarzinia sp. TaxID=2027920 RepID=UPI003566E5C3
MKFGLFNLMTYRDNPGGLPGIVDDMRSLVGLAEAIGFDTAWFAEHHFTNYSISVSPLMFAAHMAGVTRRIRLGAAVVVLPLYHPMRVAQEIALVDQLSEGRFVLGVGTGYQAYEFERYGVDVAAKTDVFFDYWEVVEQALMQGRVQYQGRYASVPDSVVLLRTRDRRMPELYVTSMDPRILARLARHGATPFLTAGFRGTPALVEMVANARSAWTTAGLAGPMPVAVQQYIHVTDSREEALEAAERARYVARLIAAFRQDRIVLDGPFVEPVAAPGEPSLEQIRDNLLIGDPHHVAERLVDEIRRIDPVHYNAFFQFGDMPIARARRSLERFGAEVLPLVEKAVGPLDRIGQHVAPALAGAR